MIGGFWWPTMLRAAISAIPPANGVAWFMEFKGVIINNCFVPVAEY
jgi:hypothetical protein